VPLSQMNVGLPFYGRSVRRATGLKQFHDGADDINYHLDEGSPQYFNIVNELGRMTTYRHEATKTQYAVFEDGLGGLVSYDDARAICDKVEYANERGMNGFLIWEISGDMIERNGEIITPLIDATNAKIKDPNYDCSTLRDPLWALGDAKYRYAPPEPEEVDWSEYVAPLNFGSANDFNGAQESSGNGEGAQASRPFLTVTLDDVPSNPVYTAESRPGEDLGDVSPGSDEEVPVVDCPLEYTGYYSTPDCVHYGYCQFGAPVGVSQPCVPGTLFDVTSWVCAWADTVSCDHSPPIEEEENAEEEGEEEGMEKEFMQEIDNIWNYLLEENKDASASFMNSNPDASASLMNNNPDASASFMNSNPAYDMVMNRNPPSDINLNININVDLNPSNFFCGISPEEAEELCIPCPSGLMVDCGQDFMRGCFRNIDACAATGNSN